MSAVLESRSPRLTKRTGVFGIGYEGTAAADLVQRLSAIGVDTVIDVRLNAISRKPGLSKRALAAALQDAGIGYLHLPALGNPSDNRAGFATPDSAAARVAHDRFSALLDTSDARSALDIVEVHQRTELVALLCFEADESTCHRALVLRSLRAG